MKIGDLVKYGKINPHMGIIVEILGKSYSGICAGWFMVYFSELDSTELCHPDNVELA